MKKLIIVAAALFAMSAFAADSGTTTAPADAPAAGAMTKEAAPAKAEGAHKAKTAHTKKDKKAKAKPAADAAAPTGEAK